jgi:DNA-binding Lrp family transcriptional regulator
MKPQEIIKLLSSETNFRILELLSMRDSYPRKIAREIGKTEGVVVRALKSMERAGILRSSWGVLDERPAKVYTLRPGILLLIIDFTSQRSHVIDVDKRDLSIIERILERTPDEFSDQANFLRWKNGTVDETELAYFSGADEEEVKRFISFVRDAPWQVFLVACYSRVLRWEKEEDESFLKKARLTEFAEKMLSKLILADPEAMEYRNMLNWKRGRINVEELATKLEVEKEEAEKFVEYVSEHLSEAYVRFHELKIRRWLTSRGTGFEKMDEFFPVR